MAQTYEVYELRVFMNGPPSDSILAQRTQKAFDFAADTTKQLIAISTAVITFTVTFIDTSKAVPRSLAWSWGFYLVSIIFGIGTLLAMTGAIGARDNSAMSIYASQIRVPSCIQLLTFLVGLAAFTVFAFSK